MQSRTLSRLSTATALRRPVFTPSMTIEERIALVRQCQDHNSSLQKQSRKDQKQSSVKDLKKSAAKTAMPNLLDRKLFTTTHDSALEAFSSRVGLNGLSRDVLANALTPSAFAPWNKAFDRYASNGSRIFSFYAFEYIHYRYPRLPLASVHEATQQYAERHQLWHAAQRLGVHVAMRGGKAESESLEQSLSIASLMAIIGALAETKSNGLATSRSFVYANLIHKQFVYRDFLTLYERERQLVESLFRRQGRPPVEVRLLKESGRFSNSSIFIVGLYGGEEKLSEGWGPSIERATIVAKRNFLRNYFTFSVKDRETPSALEFGLVPSLPQHPLYDTPPKCL